MARAAVKAQKAPKAAAKKEDAKATRMKKDPAAGADDFNKIPMGKEQAVGKKAGKAEKAAAGKKPAADQKKKQQRRGK